MPDKCPICWVQLTPIAWCCKKCDKGITPSYSELQAEVLKLRKAIQRIRLRGCVCTAGIDDETGDYFPDCDVCELAVEALEKK